MKLLLDEHVDPAIADGLRGALSIEVMALRDWKQGIHLHAQDDVLLRAAYDGGWTLVTYDQRTIRPLVKNWGDQSRPHGGVIFVDDRTITQNDVGGLIRSLQRLVEQLGDVSWEDRVMYLARA